MIEAAKAGLSQGLQRQSLWLPAVVGVGVEVKRRFKTEYRKYSCT